MLKLGPRPLRVFRFVPRLTHRTPCQGEWVVTLLVGRSCTVGIVMPYRYGLSLDWTSYYLYLWLSQAHPGPIKSFRITVPQPFVCGEWVAASHRVLALNHNGRQPLELDDCTSFLIIFCRPC